MRGRRMEINVDRGARPRIPIPLQTLAGREPILWPGSNPNPQERPCPSFRARDPFTPLIGFFPFEYRRGSVLRLLVAFNKTLVGIIIIRGCVCVCVCVCLDSDLNANMDMSRLSMLDSTPRQPNSFSRMAAATSGSAGGFGASQGASMGRQSQSAANLVVDDLLQVCGSR